MKEQTIAELEQVPCARCGNMFDRPKGTTYVICLPCAAKEANKTFAEQNKMPQIFSIASNMIVFGNQMHKLAQEQFAMEHQIGSRSDNRGTELAKMGTLLQGMIKDLARVKEHLETLSELPLKIDPDAAEKPGDYETF